MAHVQRIEADVRVSTQHGTMNFSIVGTGAGVDSLDKLGAYVGAKVHEEVSRIVGFEKWTAEISEAKAAAQAARDETDRAIQALKDERAAAEQQRLAKIASGAKRA